VSISPTLYVKIFVDNYFAKFFVLKVSVLAKGNWQKNAHKVLVNLTRLSILHLAAVNNHTSVVQLILKHVPSLINDKNSDGSTPLHLAITQRNLGVVNILLTAIGIDVNAVANDGMTALHVAASISQSDVVKMLLSKGAKTNMKTNRGLTPLHYAVWYGKSEVRFSCFKPSCQIA